MPNETEAIGFEMRTMGPWTEVRSLKDFARLILQDVPAGHAWRQILDGYFGMESHVIESKNGAAFAVSYTHGQITYWRRDA